DRVGGGDFHLHRLLTVVDVQPHFGLAGVSAADVPQAIEDVGAGLFLGNVHVHAVYRPVRRCEAAADTWHRRARFVLGVVVTVAVGTAVAIGTVTLGQWLR